MIIPRAKPDVTVKIPAMGRSAASIESESPHIVQRSIGGSTKIRLRVISFFADSFFSGKNFLNIPPAKKVVKIIIQKIVSLSDISITRN
jgi:hypothetical protein